jgi:mannan endo-1,4-beta-mannosidase
VNYYSGWEEPFNGAFAEDAYADGIETFVEMEPWNCGNCPDGSVPAMTGIAAGQYDDYLVSFGQAIKAFGHPVLVTFAHEMNGSWYPWGNGGSEGTSPEQWIAAWDHVVTVINAQAPGLVTWVWAPNVEIGAGPIAAYWPGSRYVGEVGLDGYLSTDSETFQSVFGQTIADVRSLTSLPIWITETGMNQDDTTDSRLAAFVDAVESSGVTGILYFDQQPTVLSTDEEQVLASTISSLGSGDNTAGSEGAVAGSGSVAVSLADESANSRAADFPLIWCIQPRIARSLPPGMMSDLSG